jgi:hypothetical protein
MEKDHGNCKLNSKTNWKVPEASAEAYQKGRVGLLDMRVTLCRRL